jgi:hypothetical protein
MAASHRAACEKIVSLAPGSQAYGNTLRTAIGLDENMLHPGLSATLRGLLLGVPDVFMVTPLWAEVRDLKDGVPLLAAGGSPTGLFEGEDWGQRRPGDSWSDSDVVKRALSHLYTYRRVIVLSADRKQSPGELRGILRHDVGPVLNADTSHGLALILFLKQPKTPMLRYGERLNSYVRSTAFMPGYFEVRA